MASETSKTKKGIRIIAILLTVVMFFGLLTACTDEQVEDGVGVAFDILLDVLFPDTEETEGSITPTQDSDVTHETVTVDGEMTVHFVSVGQSDATLFVCDGEVMLFDAALKTQGDELVEYIKGLGIDKIDVLVLTHPHDDHMGGAAYVLNNLDVEVVYGPDIFEMMADGKEPGWYEDMLDAVDRIDAERNPGIPEEEWVSIWKFPRNDKGEFVKFNIGDAVVEFLAPLEDEYSDKNDYSICVKVTYGTIDIMMTGDATSKVEKDLIAEGYNLDVEIFQSSHHGSDTGNSEEFLEAMTPECIVISCGMKNRYNHPIKSVMELFEELKLPVYRTDESGHIVMTTDGTSYSFNVEAGTYTSGAEYKEQGE